MFYDFNATKQVNELNEIIENIFDTINEADIKLRDSNASSLLVDEARQLLRRAYIDNKGNAENLISMVYDVANQSDAANKQRG